LSPSIKGSLEVSELREITERKLADKLLLETKESYDNIANMSPYAIVIYREGILEYVNPKGVSLFGANSESEVIGQPIIRFVHPDFHLYRYCFP
jgi:two-component system sporulation sensor kinase A